MGGFASFFTISSLVLLDHIFREENCNQYDFYELSYKEFHIEIGDNFHYVFPKTKFYFHMWVFVLGNLKTWISVGQKAKNNVFNIASELPL